MKAKRHFSVFNTVVFVLLAFHAAVLLFLLVWSVFTSLRTVDSFDKSFFGFPDFAFGNFKTVFENFNFIEFRNSVQYEIRLFPDIILYTLIWAVGGSFVGALVPMLVAYCVGRFPNFVSRILYTIVIVTMIVPIIGSQPAMITVLSKLGLFDNILGIWILRANFLGMYFLIYVAAFRSMPDSYMEAAYLDGASEFRVMVSVMLPLARTIFATVMVIQFVDCWNDYNTPLLYFPTHPTLSYAVFRLANTAMPKLSKVPLKMAACTIMIIPTTIVFVLFRNKLMGNLSMGGLKG